MDKHEFVEKLNKVTLELNAPLFFHRTHSGNLKSILEDGALLPLNSRKEHNYNYGESLIDIDYNYAEREPKIYEKYLQSVFVGFKPATYSINLNQIIGYNIVFIINPYNLKEEVLQNSFLCHAWNFGIFDNKECRKWKKEKSIEFNIKKWEKFIIKKLNRSFPFLQDEVVIRTPEGINFNDILRVNPKGVMIVIYDIEKASDEVKNLVEQYPEYQWVFIK